MVWEQGRKESENSFVYNSMDLVLSFLFCKPKHGRGECVHPRNSKDYSPLACGTRQLSEWITWSTTCVSCELLGCPAGNRALGCYGCTMLLQVLSAGVWKEIKKKRRREKFDRSNSQGGEMHTSLKWRWQSVPSYTGSHIRKKMKVLLWIVRSSMGWTPQREKITKIVYLWYTSQVPKVRVSSLLLPCGQLNAFQWRWLGPGAVFRVIKCHDETFWNVKWVAAASECSPGQRKKSWKNTACL